MTGIVRAPDFDQPGLAWFNVAAPLTLADLRGKLVILDFWTFCCINCMHILPSLRLVEEAFPDEVVVIGVHSPKFAAELDPANVAAAIARYGIVHPVIHDPDFRLWREYAVRAWPTLLFVSPDGRVICLHSGQPDPDRPPRPRAGRAGAGPDHRPRLALGSRAGGSRAGRRAALFRQCRNPPARQLPPRSRHGRTARRQRRRGDRRREGGRGGASAAERPRGDPGRKRPLFRR